MSPGMGIRCEYGSDRVDGPRLSILISKPFLNQEMACWTCEIRLESDSVCVRNIHGASSLQALGLAVGIVPALIQSMFPGETFTENGVPVLLPSDVWPGI